MALSQAIDAVSRIKLLTPREEETLWRKFTPEARAKLILSYQPLVVGALKRLAPSDALIEDCFSEGLVALIRSVDRFRFGIGVSFSTYARLRIKGAMLDLLRKSARDAVGAEEADLGRFLSLAASDEPYALNQDRLAEVLRAIDNLCEKERAVLKGLYIDDRSRTEVAESLGVTPARISQIHARAIRRLRGRVFARRRRLSLQLAGKQG
ncbi:sigma-70 family RNA polymerase sigma factor [bacterium]|nr:sigma-70 family RNA polymerase sigma factor [bacterium]